MDVFWVLMEVGKDSRKHGQGIGIGLMRKTLLITLTCLPLVALAGGDFDRGFEKGFCEGWRYVRGEFSLPPLVGIPPLPRLGEDGFFDGYNRGFIEGVTKAEGR